MIKEIKNEKEHLTCFLNVMWNEGQGEIMRK